MPQIQWLVSFRLRLCRSVENAFNGVPLLKAAEWLQMAHLHAVVVAALIKGLSNDNILAAWDVAEKYSVPALGAVTVLTVTLLM